MRILHSLALIIALALPVMATAQDENVASGETMTATDKIVQKFMELDLDENEGVSFDEYMEMVYERAIDRFGQMDSNGNGEVTSEEYRSFWKERMAKYYRLKK